MAQSPRTGDLTTGPMLKKIILFSLPLAASSILQLLFNAADVVVIGRFVGSTALAAVGSNGALINLLVNLFVGLSLGANVVAARCFGAKDERGVQNTVQTSVTLGLVSGVLLGFVAVFGLLTLWQWVSKDTRDLPEVADGPYVLLSDLGVEGERSQLFYDDRTSKITVERSLLATHYDVFEVVGEGGTNWMYQDVYRLNSGVDREVFVQSLMDNSTFARSQDNYREVTVEGLERAWVAGDLECMAVKEDLVAYVTVLKAGQETDETLELALHALAECWGNEES